MKNIQIRHYLGSRKQKIIRRYRIIFSSLWNPQIFRHYGILAITGWILFFSNLAVEEVQNYGFLLDHSHLAYVEPLSNQTSSTAKLEKKDPPRMTIIRHYGTLLEFLKNYSSFWQVTSL